MPGAEGGEQYPGDTLNIALEGYKPDEWMEGTKCMEFMAWSIDTGMTWDGFDLCISFSGY